MSALKRNENGKKRPGEEMERKKKGGERGRREGKGKERERKERGNSLPCFTCVYVCMYDIDLLIALAYTPVPVPGGTRGRRQEAGYRISK